jgi:hypothetical protein
MRNGFLASLATLAAGAGLAFAQASPPSNPTNPTPAPFPFLPTSAQPEGVSGFGNDEGLNPAAPSGEPSLPMEPWVGVSVPDDEPNAFCGDQEAPTDKKKAWQIFPLWKGPGRVWASADYLLWEVKKGPVPVPLVTTGTPASQAILGVPGTAVLFGNTSIDYGDFSGGRFSLGVNSEDHTSAIEGNYFFLASRHSSFGASSDVTGSPVFGRPFINSLTGTETVSLISLPGAFTGSVGVGSSLDLKGAEMNFVQNASHSLITSVDLLVGFRYLNLRETLAIAQTSTLLPGGSLGFEGSSVLAPATISVSDNFTTRNEFYGGQVGAQVEFRPWKKVLFVLLSGKVAFGDTHEVLNSTGQSSLSGTGGPTQTVPGGLLAAGSTSGRSGHDQFSVVPEGLVAAGIDIAHNVRLYAGYSYLFWDDVLRPGNQINRIQNPSAVPTSLTFGAGLGTPVPPSSANRSDFWAQGLTVGVAILY